VSTPALMLIQVRSRCRRCGSIFGSERFIVGATSLSGALISCGENTSATDIAFARALLQRPTWLFLDEATSNLDDASQMKLYELLTRRLSDTAMLSIAGREQLASHHGNRWELRANPGGAYELRQLEVRAASA
jgi:ABC-type uncharacterized transport system fused permease/ATPase subunit